MNSPDPDPDNPDPDNPMIGAYAVLLIASLCISALSQSQPPTGFLPKSLYSSPQALPPTFRF